MAIARSFRDLNVYREAREAAQKIFELSREFPAEERYSLTDQIRRSSRAVKAMIAEAWGRRRYKAVFVNKLDEALGEANETESWLDDARDRAVSLDRGIQRARLQIHFDRSNAFTHDRSRRRFL